MSEFNEPWDEGDRYAMTDEQAIIGSFIKDSCGETVAASVFDWGSPTQSPKGIARLERIVACVNFCRGIPTEELESGALQEILAEAKDAISKDAITETTLIAPSHPMFRG